MKLDPFFKSPSHLSISTVDFSSSMPKIEASSISHLHLLAVQCSSLFSYTKSCSTPPHHRPQLRLSAAVARDRSKNTSCSMRRSSHRFHRKHEQLPFIGAAVMLPSRLSADVSTCFASPQFSTVSPSTTYRFFHSSAVVETSSPCCFVPCNQGVYLCSVVVASSSRRCWSTGGHVVFVSSSTMQPHRHCRTKPAAPLPCAVIVI